MFLVLNWRERKKRSVECKSDNKLCDPQNVNALFIVSGADTGVNSNALKSLGFQVCRVSAVKIPREMGKQRKKQQD